MTPAPPHSPTRPRPRPKPLLRLQINDLSDPSAQSFLRLLDASSVLDEAVRGVLDHLYGASGEAPPTRSVTLILRGLGGVAYTTGKDIDADHKEIHFSTDYIGRVPTERRAEEMLGVIRHEMVHCWQWNARGTAPGGLIEGIADWVRLRSGFAPPHWKREAGGDWDAGYQHTGYFLEFIEQRFGEGSVRRVNEGLRHEKYDEEKFWKGLFGCSVKDLWKEYGKSLKDEEAQGGKNAEKGTETEKKENKVAVEFQATSAP